MKRKQSLTFSETSYIKLKKQKTDDHFNVKTEEKVKIRTLESEFNVKTQEKTKRIDDLESEFYVNDSEELKIRTLESNSIFTNINQYKKSLFNFICLPLWNAYNEGLKLGYEFIRQNVKKHEADVRNAYLQGKNEGLILGYALIKQNVKNHEAELEKVYIKGQRAGMKLGFDCMKQLVKEHEMELRNAYIQGQKDSFEINHKSFIDIIFEACNTGLELGRRSTQNEQTQTLEESYTTQFESLRQELNQEWELSDN